MRAFFTTLLILLVSVPALAQRPKFDLNAQTPEGRLLQEAASESDETKKAALFGQFLAAHPDHPGTVWAWMQVQPIHLKAGQFDKVIQAAEAVLKADPVNSVAAYNALQACEKKADAACVKQWSARTVDAANKMIATAKPEDESEAEEWAREVDFAKQVITRCEYSLYAFVLQATDPAIIIDLSSALEERHPDSQYLPQIASRYYLALTQSGNKEKAIAVAERAVERDNTNEDLIVVLADSYLQSKKDNAKALRYASMLVDVMEKKPAPEGVAADAWEKKKTTMLGLGHWMKGMVHAAESKWADTDKAFRESLPHIKNNNDLLGAAYFYLGLSNYNMSKATRNAKLRAEAARFNELGTRIQGPYQQSCVRNLNAINLGK